MNKCKMRAYTFAMICGLLAMSYCYQSQAEPVLITNQPLTAEVIAVTSHINTNRCYAKNSIGRLATSAGIQALLGSVGGSYASYLNGATHQVTNQVAGEHLAECSNTIELYRVKYRSPYDGKIHRITTRIKVTPGQTIRVME